MLARINYYSIRANKMPALYDNRNRSQITITSRKTLQNKWNQQNILCSTGNGDPNNLCHEYGSERVELLGVVAISSIKCKSLARIIANSNPSGRLSPSSQNLPKTIILSFSILHESKSDCISKNVNEISSFISSFVF